jgi:ribosomal 50S subunit-associated protein YjgA (DUF615 family)
MQMVLGDAGKEELQNMPPKNGKILFKVLHYLLNFTLEQKLTTEVVILGSPKMFSYT